MVKVYVFAAFLLVAVVAATAAPTDKVLEPLESAVQEEHRLTDRHRRLTCDLLYFMGDSACAANCISLGKAGGHCESGICVCRRDTLSEQLERRFGSLPTIPPFILDTPVEHYTSKNIPNPYS